VDATKTMVLLLLNGSNSISFINIGKLTKTQKFLSCNALTWLTQVAGDQQSHPTKSLIFGETAAPLHILQQVQIALFIRNP
jgi:hypothetical protein